MTKVWCAPIAVVVLLCACGTAQEAGPGSGAGTPTGIPARLDIVCRADGSTELLNTEVRASADGVHIQVDNRAGEFVSLNNTGRDFSEGVTEQVAASEPGDLKVACWPGSMHRGPEPELHAATVHDPDGYWVQGELECPRDDLIAATTNDFMGGSQGIDGDPERIARKQMDGLEPDDEIFTVGYPEGEQREVAIERNDEIIALLSYYEPEEGGWLLGSYSACDSARINESYD